MMSPSRAASLCRGGCATAAELNPPRHSPSCPPRRSHPEHRDVCPGTSISPPSCSGPTAPAAGARHTKKTKKVFLTRCF